MVIAGILKHKGSTVTSVAPEATIAEVAQTAGVASGSARCW